MLGASPTVARDARDARDKDRLLDEGLPRPGLRCRPRATWGAGSAQELPRRAGPRLRRAGELRGRDRARLRAVGLPRGSRALAPPWCTVIRDLTYSTDKLPDGQGLGYSSEVVPSQFLDALPSVAGHPLALAGYAIAVGAWLIAGLKVRKANMLFRAVKDLPPADQFSALQLEYRTVPKAGLSAEQFLRSQRQNFVFAGFCVTAILLVVIFGLVSQHQKPAPDDSTTSNQIRLPKFSDDHLGVLVVDFVDEGGVPTSQGSQMAQAFFLI